MVKSGGAAALVFALTIPLGGCASGGPIPVGVAELPSVTRTGVQPGDQVSIAFYTAAGERLEEVSGDRTVDPNGELFLPFLGTVAVAGMGSADIRRLLAERYGTLYSNPVVEVVAQVHVNVTGAVRNPGQYFVPSSATLVDALTRAGGSTSDVDLSMGGGASDPSQVRLVRDGVGTVIDMRPLSASPEVIGLLVQSGDWLFVPRAQSSRLRENVTFWGSVFSTLFTAASLVILITQ
jgi:protein involved in polysaccharide export with SLBB domain